MPCAPCSQKRLQWKVTWSDGTVSLFATEEGAKAAAKQDPREGTVSRR